MLLLCYSGSFHAHQNGQSILFLKLNLFVNINSYYKTISGMRNPIVSVLILLSYQTSQRKTALETSHTPLAPSCSDFS